MTGHFEYQLIRDGKVIRAGRVKNTTTLEGRTSLLNVQFRGATQQGSWFIGLVDNSGWSSNPETDQMSNHPGWAEFIGYSQTTRPQWNQSAASAATITSSSQAVFTVTSAGSLKGFFVSSNSTKSGTSGILWCSVPFTAGIQTVQIGDELRVTYNYSISG